MSRPQNAYIKLPGHKRRHLALVNHRVELFLAADHLLLVSAHYFTERYQRFDLKDIRVITVCATARYEALTALFGLAGGFATLGAVLVYNTNDPFLAIALGIIATVAFLLLLYNLVLGPTCTTRIHTAVSKEVVFPWRRRRKTRKALAILCAAIAEVQGVVPEGVLDDE